MTKRERARFLSTVAHLHIKDQMKALETEMLRRMRQAHPPITKTKPPKKAVRYAGSVRQKINAAKHGPGKRKRRAGQHRLAKLLGVW